MLSKISPYGDHIYEKQLRWNFFVILIETLKGGPKSIQMYKGCMALLEKEISDIYLICIQSITAFFIKHKEKNMEYCIQ